MKHSILYAYYINLCFASYLQVWKCEIYLGILQVIVLCHTLFICKDSLFVVYNPPIPPVF